MNRILLLLTAAFLMASAAWAGVSPAASSVSTTGASPANISPAAASSLVPLGTAAPVSAGVETVANAEASIASTPLTAKQSKRAFLKRYKAEVRQLMAQRKAERRGETVTAASAGAAVAVNNANTNLRFRLILGLIGIGAAILFYALGEPIAGTIFLIPGIVLFVWWAVDYF